MRSAFKKYHPAVQLLTGRNFPASRPQKGQGEYRSGQRYGQ